MKIQLHTDVHIDGTEALAAQVGATIEGALERHAGHISRVEVHLSDESGAKRGQNDQRCMLEARLEGRPPVAVTDHAATLDQAVKGAAQKLAHLLDSTLGRLHDHHQKASGLPLSGIDPSHRSDRPLE
jgi:ribosome-associated translation inhibitor RaiA